MIFRKIIIKIVRCCNSGTDYIFKNPILAILSMPMCFLIIFASFPLFIFSFIVGSIIEYYKKPWEFRNVCNP